MYRTEKKKKENGEILIWNKDVPSITISIRSSCDKQQDASLLSVWHVQSTCFRSGSVQLKRYWKKKKQRTRSTGNRSFITFLLLLLLRYIALSFQRHLLDTNTNVLFFPLDSSLLRGIVPCLSSTMFSSSFLSVLFSKRRDVYRAFMRERLCLIVGD